MTERLAIDGGSPVREGPPIPLVKATYGDEELNAILDVLDRGALSEITHGATKVRDFEKAFAEGVATKHAIACSSGTTAQHVSLATIEVGPGDEVIVPPLTFISTAYTVLLQNAVPIFADVDEGTITLDPAEVKKKITVRTKAIVPVHWFGHPAEMDEILEIAAEHDLKVIEDCAHANGTEYKGRKAGTIGDMACWSLQETKIITALGEGGVITTDDDELARKARIIRDHGKVKAPPTEEREWYGSYQVVTIGNHYRMTEIQAAFALAQSRKVEGFRQARKRCTEYLDSRLRGLDGLLWQERKDYVTLSYAYYPVRFDSETFEVPIDQISRAVLAEGVQTFAIGLDELCHVHPLFTEQRGRGAVQCPFKCPLYEGNVTYEEGMFPKAERIAKEILLLPLYPELQEKDLQDIVRAVKKIVQAYR
jgi:perosamine synthetase